jgi:hypothetical protein
LVNYKKLKAALALLLKVISNVAWKDLNIPLEFSSIISK